MTLLEVLVSVSMLAVILGALYAAYTSNLEAIEEARVGSRSYQTARIVFDMMGKEIQSAYINTDVLQMVQLGIVAEDREAEGRPADRIDFSTLKNLNLAENGPRTDLCEVGYYVEEDDEKEGEFILYRRSQWAVDDDLTTGGASYELARGITGFDLVFQDDRGEEFENWNTLDGTHKDTLPLLVRVSLALKDERGEEMIFVTSFHPELAVARGR